MFIRLSICDRSLYILKSSIWYFVCLMTNLGTSVFLHFDEKTVCMNLSLLNQSRWQTASRYIMAEKKFKLNVGYSVLVSSRLNCLFVFRGIQYTCKACCL